jgi:hypothetical protein
MTVTSSKDSQQPQVCCLDIWTSPSDKGALMMKWKVKSVQSSNKTNQL